MPRKGGKEEIQILGPPTSSPAIKGSWPDCVEVGIACVLVCCFIFLTLLEFGCDDEEIYAGHKEEATALIIFLSVFSSFNGSLPAPSAHAPGISVEDILRFDNEGILPIPTPSTALSLGPAKTWELDRSHSSIGNLRLRDSFGEASRLHTAVNRRKHQAVSRFFDHAKLQAATLAAGHQARRLPSPYMIAIHPKP